ncbi:hypothetical protein DMI69_05220 [Escherichia coli]|nr:hypothetical protein [Escherichia coli]
MLTADMVCGSKMPRLTSEQQTAWQKIHNDFYAQSSALQQQLVTKRYEYNALLAANPPDSSKINAFRQRDGEFASVVR